MSDQKRAVAKAATEAIRYNVPVDGFGQAKRLDEYAAIWGNAVAQKLVTDGLVGRDESTVKAEALEEAAGHASITDVGLGTPGAHEKATEWLLAKANKLRAGESA